MITETICNTLGHLGIEYETITHPAVSGCDDSNAHRSAAGWSGVGSKCILFHAKGAFHLVVTTADTRINARRFKKEFGTKNIRFATPEEALERTGCAIGSMPPFGHAAREGEPPTLYVDRRVFEAPRFMFNPANPEMSVAAPGDRMVDVYKALPTPVRYFTIIDDKNYYFSDNPDEAPPEATPSGP